MTFTTGTHPYTQIICIHMLSVPSRPQSNLLYFGECDATCLNYTARRQHMTERMYLSSTLRSQIHILIVFIIKRNEPLALIALRSIPTSARHHCKDA